MIPLNIWLNRAQLKAATANQHATVKTHNLPPVTWEYYARWQVTLWGFHLPSESHSSTFDCPAILNPTPHRTSTTAPIDVDVVLSVANGIDKVGHVTTVNTRAMLNDASNDNEC